MTPSLTLHHLAMSHPSRAVRAALELKGLDYENAELAPGPHVETMAEVYGEGNTTVPGMVVDGEPVHGSSTILARLEEIAPDPPLFPQPIADEVREAERWGNEEFQDLGRHLAWGVLHFRPEAMATFAGGELLDPAGTDFAIKYLRGAWRYHGLSAELIASGLAGLPAKLDHIDDLAKRGIIGGERANAADLQIGSTIRVLLTIGDLDRLLEGRAGVPIARRWFGDYPGEVPAGGFPAAWIPTT